MSAQTIIHPSISSIKEESEDLFIKNADKHLLERRFRLGDGYCRYEQLDAAIIYDIIQSNDCELLNLIKEELEKVETADQIEDKYSEHIIDNAHDNLYELWLNEGNSGTKQQFLDLAFEDTKADWDEIKW